MLADTLFPKVDVSPCPCFSECQVPKRSMQPHSVSAKPDPEATDVSADARGAQQKSNEIHRKRRLDDGKRRYLLDLEAPFECKSTTTQNSEDEVVAKNKQDKASTACKKHFALPLGCAVVPQQKIVPSLLEIRRDARHMSFKCVETGFLRL